MLAVGRFVGICSYLFQNEEIKRAGPKISRYVLISVMLVNSRTFLVGLQDPSCEKLYIFLHELRQSFPPSPYSPSLSRWWFQIFFIFTPIWGRFPF